MRRRPPVSASLVLVPCRCQPGESMGGGVATPEPHVAMHAAALAVKGHIERIGTGGHPYWAVHFAGAKANRHVTSVTIGDWRYGGWDASRKAVRA